MAGPIGMSPGMMRFPPEGLNQAPMMTQLSPQQQVQIQQQIQQRQMQMQHQHLHQQHQQLSASLSLNLAKKKPRYPPPQGPNPPVTPRPIALVRRPSQGGSLPSSGGGRNGSPNIHSAHLAPTGGVKNTSVAPMSSQVDKAGPAPPRPPFHSGPRVTREEVEHHMEVGSRYVYSRIQEKHLIFMPSLL